MRETRLKSTGHIIEPFRSHRHLAPVIYHTQLRLSGLRMILPVWVPSSLSPSLLPLTLEFEGGGKCSVHSSPLRLQVSALHLQIWCPFSGTMQPPVSLQTEYTDDLTCQARARQTERLTRTNSFSGRGHRERIPGTVRGSLPRSVPINILEMHRVP